MGGDCLVCREVAGEIGIPGGLLWEDDNAVAFHLPPMDDNPRPYLGHCMVVTRRTLTTSEISQWGKRSRSPGDHGQSPPVYEPKRQSAFMSRSSASVLSTSTSLSIRGIRAYRREPLGRQWTNFRTPRTAALKRLRLS